ncbi:MAG TPA: tetratricopeptide repeat protein [Phenylobacterium sp.]|jgi:tetratricopeptide (TPR) repeat protein|nr:tetratricopeptide repeat protein [Phenylobacterium sp.]
MQADLADAIRRHRAGDLAGAEAAYLAIVSHGEHADALCNLGLIAKARGRLDEAETYFVRAVQASPGGAISAYNLGSLYWRAGRLADALPLLETAARHPQMTGAKENLGHVYLALGRDAEGWPLHDERTQRTQSKAQGLSFPEWRGEPLAGKRLFLWAEQGFGDQILAARFIPHLGAEVTYVCAPELARLFDGLGATVIPRAAENPIAPHDYWSLPLSLPRWCGPVPNSAYLTGHARSPSGGVGVAWKGNALPDPGRSLPPDLAGELLALPGALSLHPEDTGARDFQDTADIVAGLDLVVTIDTSIAHLAGALGKPTLVLLQHHIVDWRWRDGPPWYASVEVLRQPAPGDWRGLVDAIIRRLSA